MPLYRKGCISLTKLGFHVEELNTDLGVAKNRSRGPESPCPIAVSVGKVK